MDDKGMEFWLDEMAHGYRDGRDRDCPVPSQNRSVSNRRGFENGREDPAKSPRALAALMRILADAAVAKDRMQSTYSLPGTCVAPAGNSKR
jgi:hypothetical protein